MVPIADRKKWRDAPAKALRLIAASNLLAFGNTSSGVANELYPTIWDPVMVFKVQMILNAGLPEGRLALPRSTSSSQQGYQTFYLKDGNVILGQNTLETDIFYVIKVVQDLEEQIPIDENLMVFKRDVIKVK